MGANSNFSNDLISSTLRHYESQLRSSILDNDNVLAMFKQKALDEVPGGRKLAYPQIQQQNDTFKSYAGSETIDVSEQQGFTNAEYAWAQYAGTVTLTGIDEFKNSEAESQIFPLLQARIQQLEETATATLSSKILSSQSGSDMLGLPDLISETNNTVGGIDSSNNSFWRPERTDLSGTFGTTMTGSGMTEMAKLMKTAQKTNQSPDLIVCIPDVHNWIETAMVDSERFHNTEQASWGFQSIPFKGAQIIHDANVPTDDGGDDQIYFINTNDLRLVIGKGRNFSVTPKVEPTNQDIKVWMYRVYLQLVCKRRYTQALLHGITGQ